MRSHWWLPDWVFFAVVALALWMAVVTPLDCIPILQGVAVDPPTLDYCAKVADILGTVLAALVAFVISVKFLGRPILRLTQERVRRWQSRQVPPNASALEIRYDALIDREHRPSDPMSGRMVAVDARKVRLVTSKDTDKLAVSVTEMRTVHGAWTHVPFGARHLFGLPAYLTLLDRHTEAVAGAEKNYGLVEKDMSQDRLIRLRRDGGAVRDFGAEADRAMCLTVEASAPSLGVQRKWFHVWMGHSAALHCEEQVAGHESPPNVPLPRAPASNELRVLGHLFATGTEIRNQGFDGRTTAENLEKWIEVAEKWEADVIAVLDAFSPALDARFKTLNERALPLPTYMQGHLLNAEHELRLRCHHAKVNFLEKDVLEAHSYPASQAAR